MATAGINSGGPGAAVVTQGTPPDPPTKPVTPPTDPVKSPVDVKLPADGAGTPPSRNPPNTGNADVPGADAGHIGSPAKKPVGQEGNAGDNVVAGKGPGDGHRPVGGNAADGRGGAGTGGNGNGGGGGAMGLGGGTGNWAGAGGGAAPGFTGVNPSSAWNTPAFDPGRQGQAQSPTTPNAQPNPAHSRVDGAPPPNPMPHQGGTPHALLAQLV